MPEPARDASFSRALLALIAGQIALHSSMAGIRMASPLAALREGHAAWSVGVLLGLFAVAPIALALRAGRLADKHGYHRPMRIGVVLTVAGGLCAALSTFLGDAGFIVLCVAAVLSGAGANVGLIAIQRAAGRMATDSTQLKRVFSWLGLAPAISNVVGPVVAGALIDLSGFALAFATMALLPLAALVVARHVPVERRDPSAPPPVRRNSWNLLQAPGFMRLLLVNWLLSSSWDVHAFLVPVLGHERGFSASAIGLVLGVFATAVAVVRLAIPAFAHRMREGVVLVAAMLVAALVFAIYPFAVNAWMMGACAVVLGLALGAVQPMIMTTLHQITPAERHGEAIALRSMAINLSSALMPLAFGLAGAAMGASALFWVMGVAVASGSVAARHVGPPRPGAPRT
jgi:MFS family permease